jgi:hypothetical protein
MYSADAGPIKDKRLQNSDEKVDGALGTAKAKSSTQQQAADEQQKSVAAGDEDLAGYLDRITSQLDQLATELDQPNYGSSEKGGHAGAVSSSATKPSTPFGSNKHTLSNKSEHRAAAAQKSDGSDNKVGGEGSVKDRIDALEARLMAQSSLINALQEEVIDLKTKPGSFDIITTVSADDSKQQRDDKKGKAAAGNEGKKFSSDDRIVVDLDIAECDDNNDNPGSFRGGESTPVVTEKDRSDRKRLKQGKPSTAVDNKGADADGSSGSASIDEIMDRVNREDRESAGADGASTDHAADNQYIDKQEERGLNGRGIGSGSSSSDGSQEEPASDSDELTGLSRQEGGTTQHTAAGSLPTTNTHDSHSEPGSSVASIEEGSTVSKNHNADESAGRNCSKESESQLWNSQHITDEETKDATPTKAKGKAKRKDGNEEESKSPKKEGDRGEATDDNSQEKSGLTTEQAEELYKKVGYNELPNVQISLWRVFLEQYMGTMPYTLELAVIIAAAVRDWIDFGIIIAIVRNLLLCSCFIKIFVFAAVLQRHARFRRRTQSCCCFGMF